MGDFETNPDMYEKSPIALPKALEKMKPFLMAYEGIENEEEWEVSSLVLLNLFALELYLMLYKYIHCCLEE